MSEITKRSALVQSAGSDRFSELYLARLNAAADTDITIVLECDTASTAASVHAALCAHASTGSMGTVGARARAIESELRTTLVVGPFKMGTTTRVGPLDVALATNDPTVVVVRWSHLAGDARTCQEAILDCLEYAGLLDGRSACRCVRLPEDCVRPMAHADAWNFLREERTARLPQVISSSVTSTAPLLRRAATHFESVEPTASDDNDSDAISVVKLRSPARSAGTSQFAGIVGTLAKIAVQGNGRAPVRLGVTVDIRRHEPRLASIETGGNLSVVGWFNLPAKPDSPAVAAHASIQRLLRRRFWYQQLAFDAWLVGLPTGQKQRGCDILAQYVTGHAPVTITEMWRNDGLNCTSCGLRRRTTPEGVTPIAIPPRYPPTGLTVGITRAEADTVVVLRRATDAGAAATPWVEAVSARWTGGEVHSCGPVVFAEAPG